MPLRVNPAFPTDFFSGLIQAFHEAAATNNLLYCATFTQRCRDRNGITGADGVRLAELDWVHTEINSDLVHQILEAEHALGCTIATEGTRWHLIGIHNGSIKTQSFTAVSGKTSQASYTGYSHTMATVSACIRNHLQV